jgi:hypothetical protein
LLQANMVDAGVAAQPIDLVNGLYSSARLRDVQSAGGTPPRVHSAGSAWRTRVPRGSSCSTVLGADDRERKRFALRLIVEKNARPPGRSRRTGANH